MSGRDEAQRALSELRASVAQSDADLAVLRSQAAAMKEEIATQRERFQRETAEAREQDAEDNRSGVNGQDRQELQRRIDRGATSWERVMRGLDQDPSAVAVREQVHQGVTRAIEQLQEEDPELREDIQRRREQNGL